MAASPTKSSRSPSHLDRDLFGRRSFLISSSRKPSIGRDYIGRIFAICRARGMTAYRDAGRLDAARRRRKHNLDVFTAVWSPAVAFGFLLVTLA